MHSRWLSRALVALVVPATLTAPALVSSAHAAPAPRVPSLAQATALYPHLAGGTATQSSGKVYGPGRNCKPGKPIKGAGQTSVSYTAPIDYANPSSFLPTGARPSLTVSALRFKSAKSAIAYLHAVPRSTRKCAGSTGSTGGAGSPGSGCGKASVRKIKFKLGDERQGYSSRITCSSQSLATDMLFVRKGKVIVYTTAMAFDGVAPAVAPAVSLTKVALRTAR
jgi:hypothetical protein